MNVHAPTKDKCGDTKDSFCEELGNVFSQFPKNHMKILLDFNAKVGREDIFKPTATVGNECLHKAGNDNGVCVVYFVTSETSDCQEYNIHTLQNT
jgi:hypothetical protein